MRNSACKLCVNRNATTLDWTIPEMSGGKPMLSHSPLVARGVHPGRHSFRPAEGGSSNRAPSEAIIGRILALLLHDQRPIHQNESAPNTASGLPAAAAVPKGASTSVHTIG
jgi:hypothetical protein